MAETAPDPRVARGMRRQFEARQRRLSAGDKALGWKVGFGAPAALARLKIEKPLVGFLLQSGRLDPGATVALAGWTKPAAEPEIAVHLGRDLGGEISADEARAAIAGLGPAIELVDVDTPPDDVETILAANIFQRHVVLGPSSAAHAGGDPSALVGRVFRRGIAAQSTSELEANTGRIVDIVREVARVVGMFGETLRAGEVIIAGSVVAPIYVKPDDDHVGFALDPIGRIDVTLAQ